MSKFIDPFEAMDRREARVDARATEIEQLVPIEEYVVDLVWRGEIDVEFMAKLVNEFIRVNPDAQQSKKIQLGWKKWCRLSAESKIGN